MIREFLSRAHALQDVNQWILSFEPHGASQLEDVWNGSEKLLSMLNFGRYVSIHGLAVFILPIQIVQQGKLCCRSQLVKISQVHNDGNPTECATYFGVGLRVDFEGDSATQHSTKVQHVVQHCRNHADLLNNQNADTVPHLLQRFELLAS